MIGKRVLGLAAVAAFGFGLALAPTAAMAKKCSKCGPKIAACKKAVKAGFGCTGKKGKDKRTCVHDRNGAFKSICVKKACLNANPCSPSGAFVD